MKKITTFLLSLLLVIPAMAYDIAANTNLYFANTNNWTAAQFLIGHNTWSEGYVMKKVSNTNLYHLSMISWGGYTQWCVFNASSKWSGEGNSVTHRHNYMDKKTPVSNTQLNSGSGKGNLIYPDATFTKLSAYTALNHTQTITIEGDGEGTTSISTYKLTAANTASSSTGTTSADAVYTATVKCTATAAEGSQFVGWYDGSTLLSESTTYSYTAENAAKTIVAKFAIKPADAPVLSNFVATPSENIVMGTTVTFSCDVENAVDGVNVVYKVGDEVLEGNTWTPDNVGTFTITATYEGAVPVSIDVVVTMPSNYFTFYEGDFVIFFVNTQDWNPINAWIWRDGGANYAESNKFPGDVLTEVVGQVGGKDCYKWVYSGNETAEPTGVIFSNGSTQTADLVYVNGGVYNADGELLATLLPQPILKPTIKLHYTPSRIFVGDKVTFSSEVFNGEGLDVKYFVNGDEVLEGNTWTPTKAATYTLEAQLYDGENIKAFDAVNVDVKEHTEFYIYLLKEGAWNPTYIYYWGDASSSSWPGNKLEDTETVEGLEYYKYAIKDAASVSLIFNGGNDMPQTADIENVTKTTYYKITKDDGSYESSATPFEPTYYDENIVCGKCYFLDPGGDKLWDQAGAWFAAYFLNKNTDAYTWVIGEQLENRKVMFYLSKYNVPGATRATEDPVYTHVIFCRMNPKYDTMGWNNELPEGSEDRVWNNTADLAWDENKSYLYKITGWGANEGYWEAGATGIEAVETAGGIVYAGNVVTAEGAIYVYNLSGAVVAYGEDNLDLRGLNSGVYVVRNGNNALKVVR